MLQFCPTRLSETELMAGFATLGIAADRWFDFDALPPNLQQSEREGTPDARKEFAAFKASEIDTGKRPASEGFRTREFIKNYLERMAAAALGIYGNSTKKRCIRPIRRCPLARNWTDRIATR